MGYPKFRSKDAQDMNTETMIIYHHFINKYLFHIHTLFDYRLFD